MTENGRGKNKPTKGFKEFQKRKRALTPEEEQLRRIRMAEIQKNQSSNEEYYDDYYDEDDGYDDNIEQPKRRIDIKKQKRKDKKKPKLGKIIKRTVTVVVCLLALIIAIVGFNIMSFLSGINNKDMIPAVEVGSNQSVNILMLGMDIGDVDHVENEAIKRTDTIMVINYHPQTKKANLVSVPRDMLIKTPNGNNAKINAAYTIGGEKYIKEQVESFLSIQINYMIKIDYQAFRDFIDSIGGIEMYIERDMYYDDDAQNLHINFKGGETKLLNGKEAEEFFRWRKNNDGTGFANGDLDRIKNQQLFISKVIDKCATPSMLFKMNNVLKSVGDNLQTNMSATKMLDLAFDLVRLDSADVNMTTLHGEPRKINGQDYLIFNKNENADLINSLKHPGSALTDIKRENISIMILNATKINGLASAYQLDFRNLGYEKVDIGNMELRDKSVIMVNDDNIKNMIQGDFKSIKKFDKKDNNLGYDTYDVIVILGKDSKKNFE